MKDDTKEERHIKVMCLVLDNQLIFLKCQFKFSVKRNLGDIFTVVGQKIDPQECPVPYSFDPVNRLLYMLKEPCRYN